MQAEGGAHRSGINGGGKGGTTALHRARKEQQRPFYGRRELERRCAHVKTYPRPRYGRKTVSTCDPLRQWHRWASGAVGAACPWRVWRVAPLEWGREAVRRKGVHSYGLAGQGRPRRAVRCGMAVTGGRLRRRERTESRRVLVTPQCKVALFDRVFLTILTHMWTKRIIGKL
jgi:hypothetical protein